MSILRIAAVIVGALTGILLFLQYFLPAPALNAFAQPVLKWIVLLSGAALLLAAANLLRLHVRNLRQRPASIALLVGFAVAFVVGLLPAGFESGAGLWLYRWLLAPGLAALFALLPIFLVYALYRHLNLRDLAAVFFAIGLLVVLLGQTPLLTERLPFLAALRHNLLVGPAAAALRGVLIGLALGVILGVFSRLRAQS